MVKMVNYILCIFYHKQKTYPWVGRVGREQQKQSQKTNGNLKKRCANHAIDIKLFLIYKELLQINRGLQSY